MPARRTGVRTLGRQGSARWITAIVTVPLTGALRAAGGWPVGGARSNTIASAALGEITALEMTPRLAVDRIAIGLAVAGRGMAVTNRMIGGS
jgi:hypothetical protein